jgi:hypothetical protein
MLISQSKINSNFHLINGFKILILIFKFLKELKVLSRSIPKAYPISQFLLGLFEWKSVFLLAYYSSVDKIHRRSAQAVLPSLLSFDTPQTVLQT